MEGYTKIKAISLTNNKTKWKSNNCGGNELMNCLFKKNYFYKVLF